MRLSQLGVAVALCAFVAGCGGGGAGTPSSSVRLFLTDDLNASYDHIWVTIDKVDLVGQDASLVTIFNESGGRVVDLRALNDSGTSLFTLLASKTVPNATYTGVQITLSKSLTVFPSGSTTGTTASFASTYDAGGGLSKLSYAFGVPKVVAGPANLVADFDLSQWAVNGTTVTALVKEGTGTGIEDNARQERDLFQGTLTLLTGTAPNTTFTLTTARGQAIPVITNTSTGFYASDGSSPILSQRIAVSVRGSFATPAGSLAADSVRIDVAAPATMRVFGTPSNPDVNAQTFDLTLGRAEGFVPNTTVVHVAMDPSVVSFGPYCTPFDTLSDFFTALTGTSLQMSVEGVYDPVASTMTATQIKLVDPSGVEGGVAEVGGTVVTSPGIDPIGGTFTLGAVKWSGAIVASGASINVVTNAQTAYKVGQLAADKASFFTLLHVGSTNIRAVGPLDPTSNTITATQLWFGAP